MKLPKQYRCQRVQGPLKLDGMMSDPQWENIPWTDDFSDITGDETRPPRFRTRAKMAWDDQYFYVAAELEEPHVWATITQQNEVIFHDNDFEVFIDPDGDTRNYYEFEMNAFGTIWELSLPVPYNEGGQPVLGCNLQGLIRKVGVRGSLNEPSDTDEGWTVEIAFPWAELAQYNVSRQTPPTEGDCWKVNFSRVQWRHEVVDGQYQRIPPHGTELPQGLDPEEQEHPEDNWVWSPQGEVNMHLPAHWGEVIFVQQ